MSLLVDACVRNAVMLGLGNVDEIHAMGSLDGPSVAPVSCRARDIASVDTSQKEQNTI